MEQSKDQIVQETAQQPIQQEVPETVNKADYDKVIQELQTLKSAKTDELISHLYKQAGETPIVEEEMSAYQAFCKWLKSHKK